ncbi:ATP-binding cassette domain-containing protein [Actinomyces sp. 2119]|uniref:ABC transporter ATP-binding protein n=1 Tax=Actinomyces sp. 2119 TaxID=2321393 RepID=UPI000E6B6A8B|nr:ATP-binding cassette domain-containing protein [Actinomyces sp. 2119]RJF42556.1 ATP-binding cassette domain-containing protein [Actinomyces sp. 2119]
MTFAYSEDDPPVFTDLSMRFPREGLVALQAPNGSGKSTLVELVSGYLRPGAGRVLVCGHDASSPRARPWRRVVRTRPALYPAMSVYDHLAFSSQLAGSRLHGVLERAGRYRLADWLDTRADELSSGTERKLWLLMCTLGNFDVVMLDEPFIALDDQARAELNREMCQWREEGRLVVVAAHGSPDGFQPTTTLRLPAPRATEKEKKE